jgi:ABC-2 type transport system permease protein
MSAFRTSLRQIRAITRRDALVQMSYQFNLLFFFSSAIFAAFIAYFVSELVGETEFLDQYEGSYFDFVLVGLALTSYASLGVAAFTDQIRQEQAAGTLEVLLSGPTRLGTLLVGGFVVPLALTTVEVGALIGLGVGLFGAGLTIEGVLLSVPIVALTVLNFCAMGVVSAAVVLLVKRGDPISGPVYQATLVLSGAIFPVELFPRWLEVISRSTPGFYGVRGTREALLTDVGPRGIVDEIAVLAGFAAVSLPVAVWCFGWSIATAKRLGVLGSY